MNGNFFLIKIKIEDLLSSHLDLEDPANENNSKKVIEKLNQALTISEALSNINLQNSITQAPMLFVFHSENVYDAFFRK